MRSALNRSKNENDETNTAYGEHISGRSRDYGSSRAESVQSADNRTGVSDKDKQTEPAECPIKKTINGVTYCFQNDPHSRSDKAAATRPVSASLGVAGATPEAVGGGLR